MFAVIYQGYVKPGRESEYQKLWNRIASYFIEHCGAIGSCLHRAPEGLWVAYSRWPDKATRDAAWPQGDLLPETFPEEIRSSIQSLRDCLDDRKIAEMHLEVVEDLL